LGVGLAVTPLNAAALNTVPAAEHGQASGVLQTVSGLGGALSGVVFKDLQDERFRSSLVSAGVHVTTARERALDGLLARAKAAETELHRFPRTQAAHIVRALREGFVFALSTVMTLGAGIALGAAVVVALLVSRARPVDEAAPAAAARLP
jgi:hypothetical protein